MLTGLDTLPRSILVWRSLTQWLGGLGILLIILLVGQSQGNQGLHLLSAEGVKVSSGRLSLNFQRAAYRFTIIYLLLVIHQYIV
jgi:trk system potassium uptake protein TrkH